MKTTDLSGYTILSFVDRPSGTSADISSFQPYAIKRQADGEIFTVGDKWFWPSKPGSKTPHGEITGFEVLEGTIFIKHTWSGIGFSLDSIEKHIDLPSQFQINDKVVFGWFAATVNGVHFYKGKVKYDLELTLSKDDVTRVYNIDSRFVKPVAE